MVSGSLRATDTLYSTTAQFSILRAPTASNGTTYGPGTANNLLKSNGNSIYWTTLTASDIPTISITDKTSGTLTVARGGTGATTAANARANLEITPANIGAIAKNETGNTQQLVRPAGLNGVDDITYQSLINDVRANRLAFLPADQIIIEETIDGGTTWTDAGYTDAQKQNLFSEKRQPINIPQINGEININCGLRITITGMKYNVPANTSETQKYNYWNSNYVASSERYCLIKNMYFWVNSGNNSIKVKVEQATGAASTNWKVAFDKDDYGMTGWSGNDIISLYQNPFGGATTQTEQFWNWRFTFMTRGPGGSTTLNNGYLNSVQQIFEIRGYGDTYWIKANEYMASDHLYGWDYSQNAIFPADILPKANNTKNLGNSSWKWANVYATTFTGNLTGNVTGNVSGTAANVTGIVAIEHGGTGATTANSGANNLLSALPVWSATPTDDTYFIRKDTAGTDSFGQVKFSTIFDYIKNKLTPADIGAVAKSGDTMTGPLYIERPESYVSAKSTTTSERLMLYVPGSGSHGLYSYGYWNGSDFINSGNWLIYRTTNGSIHVNGNAATATKLSTNASNTTASFWRGDNTWSNQLANYIFNTTDIPEEAADLNNTATAHKMTFYRNGITIPYQMDNANDGGILRVRGTSESDCIFELGTWNDSGAGETIQFNYYSTASQVTPAYSVSVPKASGTICLTNGTGANGTWGISISGNAASASTAPTVSASEVTNANVDTMYTTGLYQIKSLASGQSLPVSTWACLSVFNFLTNGNNSRVAQVCWHDLQEDDRAYYIRTCYDGTWTSWKRIALADGTGASGTWDITATSSPKLILQASNVTSTSTNTYATNGLNIRWFNEVDKLPGQPSQYGFLLTLGAADNSPENHQIFATQADGSLYHRGTNGSSYTNPPAFKTILDNSNYTNWAVAKSGGTMTGSLTIQASLTLKNDTYVSGTAPSKSLWNIINSNDKNGIRVGVIHQNFNTNGYSTWEMNLQKRVNNTDYYAGFRVTGSMTSTSINALIYNVDTKALTGGKWQGDAIDILHGGTGATTAANARSNLGINSSFYRCRGYILTSPDDSNIKGFGHAIITVINQTVIINFEARITNTSTINNKYSFGIFISNLKTINSSVPNIKPSTTIDGVLNYYDNNGALDLNSQGYAGSAVGTTPLGWAFGRIYNTNGDFGQWTLNHYSSGMHIIGTLYGILA